MKHNYTLIFLALAFLSGCAAHTAVEPAGKGRTRASLNIGGPFVNAFDTYIPVPYLSAGAGYGLSDNIDLDANLHILSLAYKIAGLDLGAGWYPVINDGAVPTLGLQARLMMLSSLKPGVESRFRVYPTLSASASWDAWLGKFYLGSDLTVPLTRQDFDEESAAFLFSPFAGYKWNLSPDLSLFTELKWQAVNVESSRLATTYIHPAGQGAIGVYFSLERSF